ncbi:GlsB/YeaQ/YmgE family stress response membrane protein [Myxococcus sp. SDU36]|uniref:GlsB/YeaQ/YmgE family stress response membrane protein n=1 Tax=Myxococcus sp. SDU36 TaxID=2831967 RepID=UPI002542B2EC|nr:GlsB/YeaQ/YmgE family stress response membrane protein [Myxococcus sp. SDU36]WIG93800.1 GlsB/YeaQ/YmgE family stress response membrane protein [Myxococcus sp. SDU36]
MGWITLIVIGLVAGLLARLIVPGRSGLGLLGTIVLGVVGSFVGGWVGSFIFSRGSVAELHPTGILSSTLGAVLILVLVRTLGLGRRRHA